MNCLARENRGEAHVLPSKAMLLKLLSVCKASNRTRRYIRRQGRPRLDPGAAGGILVRAGRIPRLAIPALALLEFTAGICKMTRHLLPGLCR